MMLPSLKQPRAGVATVELAIVSPIIFMVIFTAIEFGRMFMAIHGLEEAAREGCRTAIVAGATSQEVEQAVADRLTTFGIAGYEVELEPNSPYDACQGEPYSVTITVGYASISWLPSPQFLNDIILTGSCTLPRETDQCAAN